MYEKQMAGKSRVTRLASYLQVCRH